MRAGALAPVVPLADFFAACLGGRRSGALDRPGTGTMAPAPSR